jgi:hypothetical protein
MTVIDFQREKQRKAEESARARAELEKRLKGGETITDILKSCRDNTPPPKTAEEIASDREFVQRCRLKNPYTKRYMNITNQIMLDRIDKKAADELKEAAQLEDVDFSRANPGITDKAIDTLAKTIAKKVTDE